MPYIKGVYIPTEHEEQVAVVEYIEYLMKQGKIEGFTAIPQNMWTKSWGQKIKAKQEGVRPGFPDMVIVTKDHVVFLEMKRIKGGVVREEQKRWKAILDSKATVSTISLGAKEALDFIDSVIKLEEGN